MVKNTILSRKISLFLNFMLIMCAAITLYGENLIGDSSFEETREYRPTFFQVGEYALEDGVLSGVGYSGADYSHGKRSLELAPGAVWEYQVFDRHEAKGVFSAALKSQEGSVAELEVEALTLGIHGGALNPKVGKERYNVGTEWKRESLTFGNPGKEGKGLYTVRVRNVGTGILRVDAVQLELGKDQAGNYEESRSSQMKSDMMRSYKYRAESDAASPDGRKGLTGEVKLAVSAPTIVGSQPQVVRGGVVFPKGVLYDPERVALFDADGNEVECQRKVLARRNTDGSVVSLLLDFQADIEAGESKGYVLRYGTEARSSGKTLAVLKNGVLEIDTGAVKAKIDSRKGFNIFDELSGGGSVLKGIGGGIIRTPQGISYLSGKGAPEQFRLEENGSLRTVLFVSGKHHAADGRGVLDYECRIHAFKGKAFFLVEYTLINREPEMDFRICSAGVMLPASGNGSGRFGIVDKPDLELPSGSPIAALTQLRKRWGEPDYRLLLNVSGEQGRYVDGAYGDGSVVSGNSALSMEDFRQLNPKALSCGAGGIGAYIWPEHGVKALALARGISTGMRFYYAPFGGLEDVRALAGGVSILRAEPEWVSETEVFGRFLSLERARREFPRFSRVEDKMFDLLGKAGEVSAYDGIFDYGDFGSPSYCSNHETEGVDNLWLRYLRGGGTDIYRMAVAAARHSRDVDVAHYRPGVAARHTHGAGMHTSYHHHAGHFWNSGLLWHYYLTGERRSLEVAMSSAAGLVMRAGVKYKAGRERHRILLHLAELYGISGNIQFRQAFEKQYAYGAGTNLTVNYYGGLGMAALRKLYEVSGDARYADELKQAAEAIRVKAEKAGRDGRDVSIGGGRDWYIFKSMGEYARVSGDRGFVDAVANLLLTAYCVSMSPADHSYSTAAPMIEAMSALGVGEPESMPERLSGINRLAGSGSFNFAVKGGDDLVLRIYKMLRFRALTQQKYKDGGEPELEYRLNFSSGKAMDSGRFAGVDAGFELKELRPKGGEACQLELIFKNDCWGAFSAGSPYRFAADRSFACRNSHDYPVAFWLRAPAAGDVMIDFRWKYRDNAFAGKTLGISLEDENGNRIGGACWNIPLNYAGKNDDCSKKFSVGIPGHLRGKPLRLLVNDVKWMDWRVQGLDFPWLADDKAGLEF